MHFNPVSKITFPLFIFQETPTLRFIQSYIGAVSSAVGIAVSFYFLDVPKECNRFDQA